MKNPILQKLRVHRSQSYHHTPQKFQVNDYGKTPKLKCALCSSAKGAHRQTSYQCATCEVPLCRSAFFEGSKTCMEMWHESEDLKVEHVRLNSLLATRKGWRRKRAHDEVDETDSDERCEGEEDDGLFETGSYSFLNQDVSVPQLPSKEEDINLSMDEVENGGWSSNNESEEEEVIGTAV